MTGGCQFSEVCRPLRNLRSLGYSRLVRFYEGIYCRRNHACCAARMVAEASGVESVPHDLLPPEIDRARQLIRDLACSAVPD